MADEEPILLSEDQFSELALAAVVGQLDVAVVEEEHETGPLPVEVAERTTECGGGRDDGLLLVEPSA